MPQSLSCVILHIVFSTKNRHPFLTKEHRPEILSYLSATARKLTDHCYRVGGVEDHVHLATAFPLTTTLHPPPPTNRASAQNHTPSTQPQHSEKFCPAPQASTQVLNPN